jgi:hypothetical protein
MRDLRFAPALVGALFVSCGGGAGGGGGGASSTAEFIASYCDLIAPCCSMAGLKGDGQQCRVLLSAFTPGMYNPSAGESCLSSLRAATGRADFCSDLGGAACDDAFPDSSGTKKPGETCTQDDDCASSSEGKVRCQRLSTGGAEIRKCQLQVAGKEADQPCVGNIDGNVTTFVFAGGSDIPSRAYLCRVADGLYCDRTTQACTRFKAIGAACAGTNECGSSGVCDGSRKCVARKNVGEACTLGSECVAGAFCQATSMTCAAGLASGAACSVANECKSSSCVNGKCEGDVPPNFGLALLCGT